MLPMKKKILIPTLIAILASNSLSFSNVKAATKPPATSKTNNVVAAETVNKNNVLEISAGSQTSYSTDKKIPYITAHEKLNLKELSQNTILTFENDVQIPIDITLGKINNFHGYVTVGYIVTPKDKSIKITNNTAYILTVKKGVSSAVNSNKKTIKDVKSYNVPKNKKSLFSEFKNKNHKGVVGTCVAQPSKPKKHDKNQVYLDANSSPYWIGDDGVAYMGLGADDPYCKDENGNPIPYDNTIGTYVPSSSWAPVVTNSSNVYELTYLTPKDMYGTKKINKDNIFISTDKKTPTKAKCFTVTINPNSKYKDKYSDKYVEINIKCDYSKKPKGKVKYYLVEKVKDRTLTIPLDF